MTEPPKLNITLKRSYTIQFSGTVGAGPNVGLTLVGGPITFPYKVTGAEITFRNDTANNLLVYCLISRDTVTSPTSPPADANLFSPFTPSAFFIGESIIKRVYCDVLADEDQKYLKVHALNNNAYAQTVNVSITIEAV